MDLLKAAILVKLTKSGKPFHTLMTLQAKKLTLALLLLGLKSLYACPLVGNDHQDSTSLTALDRILLPLPSH